MKIAYPGFNQVYHMKQGVLNSLVIENPTLLYEFVDDIRHQINKEDGKTIFSDNNEVLIIHKSIELLTDVYGINLNSKQILSRIIEYLSERAVDEVHYTNTMQLLTHVNSFVTDLTRDLDCEIECMNILPKQILKSVNLSVVEENRTLSEKILQYLEFTCQLFGDKIFIFVNVRGYVDEREFSVLAETIVSHDFKCLFIDNKEYTLLSKENRHIIDIDLCEF